MFCWASFQLAAETILPRRWACRAILCEPQTRCSRRNRGWSICCERAPGTDANACTSEEEGSVWTPMLRGMQAEPMREFRVERAILRVRYVRLAALSRCGFALNFRAATYLALTRKC